MNNSGHLEFGITNTCPCNIQRFFKKQKLKKKSLENIYIFLIFLFKTFIVGTC